MSSFVLAASVQNLGFTLTNLGDVINIWILRSHITQAVRARIMRVDSPNGTRGHLIAP